MNADTAEVNAVLELCRDHRRRAVLALLVERRASITVGELASAVVERDDAGSATATDGDVDRLRLSLHHVHLPKLVASGVVEYDAASRVVEPTPAFDRLAPLFTEFLQFDPQIELTVE